MMVAMRTICLSVFLGADTHASSRYQDTDIPSFGRAGSSARLIHLFRPTARRLS